jgi:hypothetical protein
MSPLFSSSLPNIICQFINLIQFSLTETWYDHGTPLLDRTKHTLSCWMVDQSSKRVIKIQTCLGLLVGKLYYKQLRKFLST